MTPDFLADWNTQLHLLVGSSDGPITTVQMTARALIIFLIGIGLVRVAATRAFGKWTSFDIIFAVIIGSNLSRALTGSAPFIPTLVATMALVALHALLARAAIRWPWLSALTKGSSTVLVRDGVVDEKALRRKGLGEGDLRMALRSAGHADLSTVRRVVLERNGDINVVAD